MLNIKTTFQRAHGKIDVKINNNEINRFYQSGSAKVFYPKSSQKFKELVLVNTAGGITSGDNFAYDFEIVNKSKIFLTTQTAERAYKGFNENAKVKISLTIDETSNLFWIPQELILFNSCNFDRNISVNLVQNSNFVLAETTIFGRIAMGEFLEKGYFNDNWRIYVNKNLIHAEALNLSGNIKETLSNIASVKDGIAVCNFFIYGKKLLSYENILPEILKNSETVLLSHSKWNDKILVRMVAKDAYDLKSLQKKLISKLAENNIPKVWIS